MVQDYKLRALPADRKLMAIYLKMGLDRGRTKWSFVLIFKQFITLLRIIYSHFSYKIKFLSCAIDNVFLTQFHNILLDISTNLL